ncbi:DUF6541 family protein [Microbacterium sp.]|uniref:DUF6541 family protein n=1 Tax=Microbacterium sp. TaxID=51671 RepID=UPI003A955424
MEWLSQWWTLICALLVLFAPGAVASWAIGLRRLALWAFAPVASVAMIVLVATVFGFAHIRWTLVSALVGLVVLAALLVAVRLLRRMPPTRPVLRGSRWPVVLGLAAGVVLTTARFAVYIVAPGYISQSNDAPFHLGAIRAIIEHGNASSFGLGGLLDPEAPGAFYPGAWHATGSLIALMSGAGIPATTNILSIVVAAAIWPLGVAWLAQTASGRRAVGAVAAAMSPALLAFPLLMIQYGILYPFMLAVALLPAAIALVVELSAHVEGASRVGRVAQFVLGIGMTVLALVVAHPSSVLMWALAVWLFGSARALMFLRRRDIAAPRRIAALAAAVVGLIALILLWWATSHFLTADYWGPTRSTPRVLIDLASSGYAGTQAAWWMSVLGLVGGIVTLRRLRTAWVSIAWLGAAFLYFVAAAVHTVAIRTLIVGPWYSDTYRLAAMIPMFTIVLAAIGAMAIIDGLLRVVKPTAATADSTAETAGAWTATALVVVVCTAVFAATPVVQRYHVAVDRYEVRSPFIPASDSWLNFDERALIARLPQLVPHGERVIANPGTGAAFAYALSGVDVYPAKWQVPRSPDYALLAQKLRDAASDPAVCEAVDRLGVDYVLDFGLGDPGTGHVKMPGFTDFTGQPGFTEVASVGSSSLWRIAACAR